MVSLVYTSQTSQEPCVVLDSWTLVFRPGQKGPFYDKTREVSENTSTVRTTMKYLIKAEGELVCQRNEIHTMQHLKYTKDVYIYIYWVSKFDLTPQTRLFWERSLTNENPSSTWCEFRSLILTIARGKYMHKGRECNSHNKYSGKNWKTIFSFHTCYMCPSTMPGNSDRGKWSL